MARQTITIRLKEDLLRKIERVSKELGLSRSRVVEEVLERCLPPPKKAREWFVKREEEK